MITSIDFREKAPLSSYPTMFFNEQGNILNNSNHEGLLPVGVPGTVAGLELAHKKYGKEDFYNGKTAELLCEFMQKNGGLITTDDLKKYTAIEREPIHGTYRGYDVFILCDHPTQVVQYLLRC